MSEKLKSNDKSIIEYLLSIGLRECDAGCYINKGYDVEYVKKDIEKVNEFWNELDEIDLYEI